MKIFVLIVLMIFSFSLDAQPVMQDKNIPEEKWALLFQEYFECIRRCDTIEKERVTPAYHEYMKKKCATPLVELLIDFEKAEQNKIE